MTTWSKEWGRSRGFRLPLGLLLIVVVLIGVVFYLAAGPSSAAAAGSYSASGQVFSLNANWTSPGGGSTTDGYASTPIQIGNTVNGTFNSGSPAHSDGTHYALYSLQALGGQRIYVTMSSGDFTPYLELWDNPNPNTTRVLAKNTGVKGSTPARLPATSGYYEIPASGTYYIFANTYSAGETGGYSLTLTSLGLSGVQISFSRGDGQAAPVSVTTGSDGTWSQTGFEEGVTYTVTPSYNGYAFANQSFTANGNQTGIDFYGMIPGIKVTAPASGQSVTAGNTLNIAWSYIGDPGAFVNIQVLQGATVVETIENQSIGSGGTGSYTWSVPPGLTTGSDYTVRVTSTSNSSYTSSSSSFSVGASGLTLTAPTGGQNWAVGQTYNITWNYAGNSAATVNIELLKNGSNPVTLATGINIDQKSYAWKIASTVAAGSDYQIRITRSDTSASVTSASPFSILASTTFSVSGKVVEVLTDPTVKFSDYYPAAPDICIGDTKANQSLSSSNSVTVVGHIWYFQEYRFNACKGQKIAINVTTNTGTDSSATVGVVLGDQRCEKFPVDNDNYNLIDWTGVGTGRWPSSNGYYEITESRTYTVCIGSFGQRTAMNFSFTLEAPPIANAAVNISKISGSNETFSANTTTDSNGNWSFSSVPPGSTYRIQPVLGDYVFTSKDISAAATNVAIGGCENHIEITYPTSSTSWDPGTTQNIYWTFWGSYNPHLKLELYKNDVYVADICQVTWGSWGEGYQDWTIPMGQAPGSDYTIKAKENGIVTATSGSFTINSITVGGRINLSTQSSSVVQTGCTVPDTGGLPAVPLRIGTQITSSYCTRFNFSDSNLYSHEFTIVPGYTYKTNCGYYFYARAGQVFRFNVDGSLNAWGNMAASFQFCVVPVQADGSYTIPSDHGYPGSGAYGFSFTAPSDGTYMALPFAKDLVSTGYTSCLYNFSTDAGAPGVNLTITPEGGSSETTTTNGDGVWSLPNVDGNLTYRATPNYLNWRFNPSYLDFKGSGTAYNFTANAPSISVSTPAAGASWGLRSSQNITWTYLGDLGSYVKIELLDSSDTLVNTIVDTSGNVSVGTDGAGSYTWLVPADIVPGSYTIRISSTDGQYTSTSGQFTISNPLSVTSPVTGDSILSGHTNNIAWSFTGADIGSTVKIELLKAGTVVGDPLTTGCPSGTDGLGSYTWNTPSTLTLDSDYQIRITSETYPAITATSANFTISGSFTASGHVMAGYYGPISSLVSTGVLNGPVSVPIAFGQTINGSIASTDYTDGFYYYDCYQLALEKDRPVAIQVQQAGNPDIMAEIEAGVNYSGGNVRVSAITESVDTGCARWPKSGFLAFSDSKFYYDTTYYDAISRIYMVNIWVTSAQTGPYTLSVQMPVSGADVSFAAQSGTVPSSVSTDANGLWSAAFDSGATYQATAQETGYTITPNPLQFDAPASDLDFTAESNASYPAITGMNLDTLSGVAGQNHTVNITVQTSGAADGTTVGIAMLTDQMRDVITRGFATNNFPCGVGTISGNQAVISFYIPGTIPAGYYQLRAILGGYTATVSRPYQLTGTSTVPAIATVTLSNDHQCAGQAGTTNITVQTSNVADGVTVSADLTDANDNPLSPAITALARTIKTNQAVLTLNIPSTLPVGSYKVRVIVSAASSLVAFKDYNVTAVNGVSEITGFSVSGQVGTSTIDSTSRTVTFCMPYGASVTGLVPTITIDGASINPTSGAARNFNSPVTYTVKAGDGSSSSWTVTCTVNPATRTGNDITSFGLPGQSEVTIDSDNKIITVSYTSTVDLSALAANFTLSDGASAAVSGVQQVSGATTNNFRLPVVYTITAEDGTSKTWTINVTSSTRQFSITNGGLSAVGKATATVSPTTGPEHSGNEVVVFQLLKNNQPVRVICTTRDIQSSETLNASFNVAGSEYSVRVMVCDSWSAGVGGTQLADVVIVGP